MSEEPEGPAAFAVDGKLIQSVHDDSDQWFVELEGGDECLIPKDPKNKYHRMILRYKADGNETPPGEGGMKRNTKRRLNDDDFMRAFIKYLAKEFGKTPGEVRQGIIDEL